MQVYPQFLRSALPGWIRPIFLGLMSKKVEQNCNFPEGKKRCIPDMHCLDWSEAGKFLLVF